MERVTLDQMRRRVEAWYRQNGRRLPWRAGAGAYAVTVSEFMLQQTGTATVIPYFDAFLRRFPSFEALADAPLEDVLAVWEGLGYYRRARSLHGLARRVAARGCLPSEEAELRGLPGVGPYTAAALRAFALHLPAVPVDGNVRRVAARLLGIEGQGPRLDGAIRAALAPAAAGDPSDFFQALMDIGATICLPKAPLCGACPAKGGCVAHQRGAPEAYGRAAARPSPVSVEVALVALKKGQEILIRRRGPGLLEGLWGLLTVEGEGEPAPPEGTRFTDLRSTSLRFTHVFSHRRWRVRIYTAHGDGPGTWVSPKNVGHPLGGPDRKAIRMLLERGEIGGP